MKVTATELANDSKSILDRVIHRGEAAEVTRHGKTVVEIQPKVGVNRKELLRILSQIKFTKAETKELKKNMEVSAVFGYAGRD
jgi:antitoxin (DNA-binding transcriptional repressor) of toxin-antitoxin stability system